MKKMVIGLTGGIATGKSSVLKMFKDLGAKTIDCDVLAREAVRKGRPALRKIRKVFGPNVLKSDAGLDRRALARIVFKNLKKRVLSKIRTIPRGVILVDVPLLFEAHWDGLFDKTLFVYSPQKIQAERLLRRNGLNKAEAFQRIRSQIPVEKKKKMADFVLDNSRDLSHTREYAARLYKTWVSTVAASKL